MCLSLFLIESDTHMFVHVKDACLRQKAKRIVIWSIDTDIIIFAIYLGNSIEAEFFMRTGTIKTRKYVPLH